MKRTFAVMLTTWIPVGAAWAQGAESYECFIEPSRTVEVASEVAGVISQLYVDRGDEVEAGQIIAELKSSVEQTSLEIAKQRASNKAEIIARELAVEFERKRLERQTDLKQRGIVSQQDYEIAEGASELARAELDVALEDATLASLELSRAEAVLEQRQIRSTFDGVVVVVHVFDSEFAANDESILSLIAVDQLYVEAILPVSEYGRLAAGDTARIATEHQSLGQLRGVVDVIDPAIDAANGTFGVRLILENPDRKIPPGLRCEVVFDR